MISTFIFMKKVQNNINLTKKNFYLASEKVIRNSELPHQ